MDLYSYKRVWYNYGYIYVCVGQSKNKILTYKFC